MYFQFESTGKNWQVWQVSHIFVPIPSALWIKCSNFLNVLHLTLCSCKYGWTIKPCSALINFKTESCVVSAGAGEECLRSTIPMNTKEILTIKPSSKLLSSDPQCSLKATAPLHRATLLKTAFGFYRSIMMNKSEMLPARADFFIADFWMKHHVIKWKIYP